MIQKPISDKPVRIEFETLELGAPDKLFIVPFGRPGSGKTRLLATAPGLGIIPLQRKTRPTVEQVMRDLYPDRVILWPKNAELLYKYENPAALALMDRDESKKFHRELFERVKQAAWALLENPKCKTIGIDDGTTLYEMVLAAHYGKSRRFISGADQKVAYGPPNDDFRDFLVSLSAKHLVMPFKSGEAYKKNVPLGFDEPKGYKEIGYECNCLVETSVSKGSFWFDIRMCQDRAALMGEAGERILSDDMCEFKFLAQQIRPDSSLEDWE